MLNFVGRALRDFYEGVGVAGDFGGLLRSTVIAKIKIPAGALGHGTDGFLAIHGELLGKTIREKSEVVRRAAATAVVVHREN